MSISQPGMALSTSELNNNAILFKEGLRNSSEKIEINGWNHIGVTQPQEHLKTTEIQSIPNFSGESQSKNVNYITNEGQSNVMHHNYSYSSMSALINSERKRLDPSMSSSFYSSGLPSPSLVCSDNNISHSSYSMMSDHQFDETHHICHDSVCGLSKITETKGLESVGTFASPSLSPCNTEITQSSVSSVNTETNWKDNASNSLKNGCYTPGNKCTYHSDGIREEFSHPHSSGGILFHHTNSTDSYGPLNNDLPTFTNAKEYNSSICKPGSEPIAIPDEIQDEFPHSSPSGEQSYTFPHNCRESDELIDTALKIEHPWSAKHHNSCQSVDSSLIIANEKCSGPSLPQNSLSVSSPHLQHSSNPLNNGFPMDKKIRRQQTSSLNLMNSQNPLNNGLPMNSERKRDKSPSESPSDSPRRTTGGPVDSFVNSKVPIDFSTPPMPSIPTLHYSMSVSEYLDWHFKVISAVESIPKFTGLLTTPLQQSWEFFCRRNGSKYPQLDLQYSYVDCHIEIWSFVMLSINPSTAFSLRRHFETNPDEYSISKTLGFASTKGFNHSMDYKNAYALLHKISTQQIVPSYVHTAEILSNLCNLQYDGTLDPKLFILQFHEYFMLGSLLGIGWPTFSDNGKALLMLSKLSGPLLKSLRWSLYSYNKIKSLSLTDVEEELTQWWINQNFDDNLSLTDETLDISEISSMDDNDSVSSVKTMGLVSVELSNNVLTPIKWAKNPLNLLSLFNSHEQSHLIEDMIDKGIVTEENLRQHVPIPIPKLSKSQKIRYKRKLRHMIIYWNPKTRNSSSNSSILINSNSDRNMSDENLTNAISSASDNPVNLLSAEKQFIPLQSSKPNPVVYSKFFPKLTLKQRKKIKKEKEKLSNNNSE